MTNPNNDPYDKIISAINEDVKTNRARGLNCSRHLAKSLLVYLSCRGPYNKSPTGSDLSFALKAFKAYSGDNRVTLDYGKTSGCEEHLRKIYDEGDLRGLINLVEYLKDLGKVTLTPKEYATICGPISERLAVE